MDEQETCLEEENTYGRRRGHGSLISTRPLPIRGGRGSSKNPFLWLTRSWRYGWYHPDEDLLGVIDVAGDALRAQIASAKAVLSGPALQKVHCLEARLENELAEDIPEIAALLGLESQINALYPPAVQRRRAWMLRERFERVAPSRAVVEYWASNPPRIDGEDLAAEELRLAEQGLRDATALRDTTAAARDEANAAATAAPAGAAGDAARAAFAAAEEKATAAASAIGLAEARRELALARCNLHRAQRDLAAAVAGARASAVADGAAQESAQAALDLARRAHGAALDAVDAREQALETLGGKGCPASVETAADADAQTLLGYIHASYMLSIGREKAVRDLMRWLVMRFWSGNVVSVVVLLLVFVVFRLMPGGGLNPLGNLVIGLFFIAAVGRIGATMSVVQRLQSAIAGNILSGDALLEITRLRTGKNGINVALFSGAVFALLLFAVFSTGAPAMLGFDNGIFPEMSRSAPQSGPPVAVNASGGKDNVEDGRETANDESGENTNAVESNAAEGVGDENQSAAVVANVSGADALEANETASQDVIADANSSADANGLAPQAPDSKTHASASGSAKSWLDRILDTSPSAQCKATQPCDPFAQFADALGFAGRADFFKLLLWAFLAGFAERLVPDVLDSISRRTRVGAVAEEEASAARRRQAAASGGGGTSGGGSG